jgi:NAD(P)H-flavin reductase/hemoglobin-like flavoprotein
LPTAGRQREWADARVVDVDRLKRSWAEVAAHGDDRVAMRFYSRLFTAVPEIRQMFPLAMAAQRDRLVTALGFTVSHVDDLDRLAPYLQHLGRDHRKFGVIADHYGPVGDALLATLGDFLGRDWTPDLAQDWADAYALVARTMVGAADEASLSSPAVWTAEVVAHERRTFDIAVMTVQPDEPYPFVPGQSLTLETAVRPRMWRYYSPANAPRDDGSIDLHVRRTPGGPVSSALVDRVQKGDLVRLGSPVGWRLTLADDGPLDLALIAGGTGLAPMKALVEQVAAETAAGGPVRRVELFVGGRRSTELYDLAALRALEEEHGWLTVTAVVAHDLRWRSRGRDDGPRLEVGEVGEVAVRTIGGPGAHAVHICGSDAMVAATLELLREAGWSRDHLHFEGFQGLGGDIYGHPDGPLERRGTPQP